MFRNVFIWLLLGGIAFVPLACQKTPSRPNRQLASSLAAELDGDLRYVREEVEALAKKIAELYARREALVAQARKEDYRLSDNGAFYKLTNDGKTALWISGVVPITEEVKEVAYLTEPLDEIFPEIHARHPEVVQSYYNDKHSLNRIYPWFDAIAQYPPKMDIPSFNFYFLADASHNPERRGVWVNEPYIDPAGRGWMVSAIAPVYYQDELVGVPGLDVTLEVLLQRYFSDLEDTAVVVMSSSGTVVMATEPAIKLLGLPPLQSHKYLETVKEDTFRPEDYNLLQSRIRELRQTLRQLMQGKTPQQFELELLEGRFAMDAAPVPETNWWVLQFTPAA